MNLADIILPLSEKTFFSSLWGRQSRHFSGNTRRFDRLFSWRELNRILSGQHVENSRVSLAKDGIVRPADSFSRQLSRGRGTVVKRFDVPVLTRQLQSGAMLIVDAIDGVSPPIRDLAEALEMRLGERVQANVYAGWKTTRGFSTHWDDHDVFVLQIAGRKRWRIFQPTREYPLFTDTGKGILPRSRPVWRGILSPGDVLYIPRGWWHDAIPVGEPSLHLTFGITNQTGIDLLESVLVDLRQTPEFRKDLPRFASEMVQESHVKRLRELVSEVLSRKKLCEHFADRDSRAPSRETTSIPFGIMPSVSRLRPDDVVRWLPPRKIIVESKRNGDFSFRALDRDWDFPGAAFRTIDSLRRLRRAKISTIKRKVSPRNRAQFDRFLFDLVSAGLIAIQQ